MTRAVAEWIGKDDDSPVPNRVRIRVADRDGWQCRSCTRSLYSGTRLNTDHVKAVINGGENRERNLQSLCDWCHAEKTRIDVAEKSKVYGKRLKHAGIKRRKVLLPGWRKFDGSPVVNPKVRKRKLWR